MSAEGRRAYGVLFLSVAAAIVVASVISELISSNNPPSYYYVIVWIGVFAIIFGIAFGKFRKGIHALRSRMKGATSWPLSAKIVNGISWAAPFITAGIFHQFYQYLILLGIGVGNLTTYLYVRKYGKIVNREQLVVSVVSLAAIPVAIVVNQWLFHPTHSTAVFISRLLIALSYGVGGLLALLSKDEPGQQ